MGAEPGQEPHHGGLWSPHDLLQVRHETREEDVRNGSDVLLADHPLRQQRRLQLEPVRSSNGQVRPCRPHHHGPNRSRHQGGEVRQRLLHQRRTVVVVYNCLICLSISKQKETIPPPKKKKKNQTPPQKKKKKKKKK